MAFPIAPLPVAAPVRPAEFDFSGITRIGDAIGAYRDRQKIEGVLAQSTDASGNLNVERAGAELAKIGLLDQARPFLALAQQKAALGQTAAAHAESARHNKVIEGLAREQYENPKPTVKSEFNPATGKVEFYEVAPGRPVKSLSQLGSAGAAAEPPAAAPAAAAAPAQVEGFDDAALAGLSPERAALVKKVANYEVNPASLSTRGGEREFIIGKASAYRPGFDQTLYATKQRTLGAYAAGVEGRTVRAVNNLTDHLEIAEQIMTALDNGDVQAFNSLKNRFKNAFGYEAPSNVAAMAPIVSGEIGKVIAGVGGGGQTERLENAAAVFGQAKSTKQALAGIGVIKGLMAGQLNGLERQYEAGTQLKNFRDRLSPQARALIEKKEGAATSPPGAPAEAAPAAPRKVQSTAEANQAVSAVRARLREMIAAGGDEAALLRQANEHLRSIGAPTISSP